MDRAEQFADAEKILKYWYTMEFLDQKPMISKEDIRKEKDLSIVDIDQARGEQVADGLQERFHTWDFGDVDYYVGSFYREDLLKRLAAWFGVEDQRVEKSTKDDFARMAFFLVQTDQRGQYVSHSFQLSPLLWALKSLNDHKGDSDALLDLKDYEQTVKKWDEKFQAIQSEQTDRGLENDPIYKELVGKGLALPPEDPKTGLTVFQGYLNAFYQELYRDYLLPAFPGDSRYPEKPEPSSLILRCASYNKKGEKEKEASVERPMISSSFYVEDLQMLAKALSEHPGDFADSPMGEVLLRYINDPKLTEEDLGARTDVNATPAMAPDQKRNCEQFMAKVLDPQYAPLGRWPTKFPPALMQQVAINMVSQMTGKYKESYFGANGPIFSVNGPPGTGKTTLLKEIIVNNIVERARLLAEYQKADDAFEKKEFKHGTAVIEGGAAYRDHRYSAWVPGYYVFKNDRINDYGMLVASCNNKAVENITTDIPVDEEVSGFIEGERTDDSFLSLDMDDFYFTAYTRKLLGNDKAWGLIAAPMGKGANLNHFFETVMDPLVNQELKSDNMKNPGREEEYQRVRGLFLEQYRKVAGMRETLSRLSHLAGVELAERAKEEKPSREAAPQQEEMGQPDRPKGIIGHFTQRFFRRTSPRLTPLVKQPERKETSVFSAGVEELRRDVDTLVAKEQETYGEKYGGLFEKYKPLDLPFLDSLFSEDQKTSTAGQTSDPGFSHAYDQERKKLFLLAMLLHKTFILSSKYMKYNLKISKC